MPNHYTIIGIGVGHIERFDDMGNDKFDFSSVSGKNLCNEVCPLPDELEYIVASNPPSRYRKKTTGEWLKDVNGPPWGEWHLFEQVNLTYTEMIDLKHKYGHATWYEWQLQNWGTKWGTYNTEVRQLSGDADGVEIEFQCAWSSPKPRILKKITDWISENYKVDIHKWIGIDPRDNSVVDICVTSK